jgi:hypothetical protein
MASLQRTNQPGDMVTSRQIRSAILPWEKQLIDTLGLTIEEYNWYANEVANHRPNRDAAYDHVPHVVCDPTGGILTAVVGIGLSFAARALAPKPKLPKQSDPAQQQQQQQQEQRSGDVTGASVTGSNRFTNVDGFTSVQPLARLGEVMPLVFANRQTFNNKPYGGVRVETKLVWSQLLSQGDGQELLALFLASAGQLAAASTPEFKGFAIGDSLLRGYQENKFAVYFQRGQPGEGRITAADKIAGGLSARGQDVFQAQLGSTEELKPLFSGVRIPTTMTQFGTSEPLRNGQHWRLPFQRIRVVFTNNSLSSIERQKIESHYGCRTGIMKVNNETLGQGTKDIFVYPNDTIEFHMYEGNTINLFGSFGVQDIAAKDDNYRQSCDDVLVIGETYLIGGAEVTCTGSDPATALWDTSTRKKYYFKVLAEGNVRLVSEQIVIPHPDFRGQNLNSYSNPADGPTISKLTLANITTTRKLNQIEIGIKSQVWKRFTGIANFASIPDDNTLSDLETSGNNYNVGSYSEYGLRYSIFRLQIRKKGDDSWISLDPASGSPFCVKGRTPIDQFNFIRIRFPNPDLQYEIRLRPISGGGYITYGRVPGNPVCVLDARSGGEVYHTVDTVLGPITVYYKGYREKITQKAATNSVMYYGAGAQPTQGAVESLAAIEYSTTGYIAPGLYNTTTGGSGSGLKVSAGSYETATQEPKGTVIIGFGTRWLHTDVLGAPYPNGEGQRYTNEAVFTHPASGSMITIKMTLTSQILNITGFNAGYIDTGGTGYMWANANAAGSFVTIVGYGRNSGENIVAGTYVLDKPSNSATPINGTVQAQVSVVIEGSSVWIADVIVQESGSNYKIGDNIQVVGTASPLPPMRVAALRSTVQQLERVVEPFDAVTDVYYYDQQEGSHQNGPEHQVVYINEQRINYRKGLHGPEEFTPQYDRMAMIGLQLRSGKEWSDFSNLTYYAKQGRETVRMVDPATGDSTSYSPTSGIIGPTHLFPEILRALLRSPLVGANKLIPESMIDWPGFQEACKVCIANQWFWDGVLASPVNIREWAYENAAYFFLDFLVLGGKLSLQPTFPVSPTQGLRGYTLSGAYDRLPTISALFTDGNIIEDSLEVSWYPAEQRLAPQVLITLRDEVEDGFAETRNILVRLAESQQTDSESAPVEAVDFTGFCTSANHAVDFAKLLIQTRRYVTHTVTFKTFPEGLALAPGAYFKLASQARHVDQFQNGYVLDDGRVVTSSELSGSNTVYWWRSGMLAVETGTMTIDGNGYVTDNKFAGAVFTVYADAQSARVYKAELISYDEQGMVEITGSHVPQEPSGKITYLNLAESLFEVQNEQ